MTGQDLLDRMELINQELQLQSGEADVVRGLLALNVAQDYFESLAALRGGILGSSTGTVVTAANTELTAFPAGVLRIDRLQPLSDSTSRPVGELRRLKRAGGHAFNAFWPLNLTASTSVGNPMAYWTNGTSIYWSPLPDAIYTIRYYGFKVASNITAGGTFAYPDIVALPLASFAARLIKLGIDDPVQDIASLAQTVFGTVLDTLSNFNRDGATGLEYTMEHNS